VGREGEGRWGREGGKREGNKKGGHGRKEMQAKAR